MMDNKDNQPLKVMGWEAMVDLAWRRIGLHPEVFITPGIPPRKVATVRALHKIYGEEPVLVLLDDTAWGGAKDGAVLTAMRLCWRDMMSSPHQRRWDSLTPAAITESDNGEVLVEGEAISLDLVPLEQRPALAAFLREVVAGAAPRPHPFRGGGLELGYRDGLLERRAQVEKRITALCGEHLAQDSDTYRWPDIPKRKLTQVRQTHALSLPDDERVLAVYDCTVFGSAEESLVITGRRLCWKNLGEQPRQIPWEYLPPDAMQATSTGSVQLGGCRVDLLGDEERAVKLVLFLRAARELFQ